MTRAGKEEEEGTRILLSRKPDLGKLIFYICNRGPGSAGPMNGVLRYYGQFWFFMARPLWPENGSNSFKRRFSANFPGTNELNWKLSKAWEMLQHRTPSKLDVSARKPKHETISLVDHKPRKIVNNLRLISLETNLAYYRKLGLFRTLQRKNR